jgi:hypothetical protein
VQVDIISNADGDDGEEKAIFGIFIKNVVPDSPAGNSGELQVSGDIKSRGYLRRHKHKYINKILHTYIHTTHALSPKG